jgi:GDP-4-dehydro-6-deoxy-D-mannose reductase
LVTGVNGFVGQHLARELHGRGHETVGVGRESKPNSLVDEFLSGYARCDLTETDDVAKLPLEELNGVINLAGLANVGDSFKNPDIYNQVNVAVLAVLGKKLVEMGSHARVLAVSTGAVYEPNQSMPLSEDSGITIDGSPYALSKLLMEQTAEQLRTDGLDCVVVRPFNHIGPGQGTGFLVPDLFDKIQSALKTGNPVKVGNLKTKRDYTDVRDVVKAYADLIEQPTLGFDLFNVCSSKSVAGEEILDQMLFLMNAKDKVNIKPNPSLIRKNDPKDLYGSFDRLQQSTGWQPSIKLEKTLKDFVLSKG